MRRTSALVVVVGLSLVLVACSDDGGDPGDASGSTEGSTDDSVDDAGTFHTPVQDEPTTTSTFQVAAENREICALMAPYQKLLIVDDLDPQLSEGDAAAVAAMVPEAPEALREELQLVADGLAARQLLDDHPSDPGVPAALDLLLADDQVRASAEVAVFAHFDCGLGRPIDESPDELPHPPDTATVEDGRDEPPAGGVDPDGVRFALARSGAVEAESVKQIWVTDHPSAGLRVHLDVSSEVGKEGGLALCRAISDHVYEQLDLDDVILVLSPTDDDWSVQREGADEACR
jgi:hypothetical protein